MKPTVFLRGMQVTQMRLSAPQKRPSASKPWCENGSLMAGPRPDITDTLVHYIRGANLDEAFRILKTVLGERRLRCGTGYIRGGHCCVCFSEAPFRYLGYTIAQGSVAERPYQPFGIMN